MPSISYQTTPKQLPDEDAFDQCSYHDQDSIQAEEQEEQEEKPLSKTETPVQNITPKKYGMSDVLEEVTDTLAAKIAQKEALERENAKCRISIEKSTEYLTLLHKQQNILKSQLSSSYNAEEQEKHNNQYYTKELKEDHEFTEGKFGEITNTNATLQQTSNQLKLNNNALTDIIHENKCSSMQELASLEKQGTMLTQQLITKGRNLDLIKKQHREAQLHEAYQVKIIKQKANRIQQMITKGDKPKHSII